MFETSEKDRNGAIAIAEHRTPAAIAAGVAFGIAIGLVPKDSLLVLLLLLFIATLPIHQLLACAVAITVSLISPWTHHIVHPVGQQVLALPYVGTALAKLYSLPLMPWLRFENTLVVGGTVLGICAWLPSYVCSLWISRATSGAQLDHEIATIASAQLRHRRRASSSASASSSLDTSLTSKTSLGHGSTAANAAISPLATVHPEGSEPVDLITELQSHHPDDLALATLVLEVQETMLEVARVRCDAKPVEDNFDGATYSTLPLAESHHGAEMTMLSPVDLISAEHAPGEMLPAEGMLPGVIMIDNPSLLNNSHPHSAQTFANKSTQPGLSGVPSNAATTTPAHASTMPVEQNALPLNNGSYRDSNGRQFFSHAGSKEESLRHILKHIHSLRNSQKQSEKTS